MEIVTWVLSGRLEHRDSERNHGELYPGLAQRMSAGTRIQHSEMNPSPTDDVHFVQMWVPPDTQGLRPSYEQRDVNDELAQGGLQPIASGAGHDGAITIHQRDAVLWVGRLDAHEHVDLPAAEHVHVFVATGSADLVEADSAASAGSLAQGDAARLTSAGALGLVAGDEGAEVLVWATA
jgi:redox-sensitive bicupin YhaK (pirin superfamily)